MTEDRSRVPERLEGVTQLSGDNLDEIERNLARGLNESLANCPEEIFVRDYLPVLSGLVKNERMLEIYIYLAGGPLKEMRVIDAAGQELFICPPWISTSHLEIGTSSDTSVPSFGEVVAQAVLAVSHNPLKSKTAFREATKTELTRISNVKSQQATNMARWGEIMNRYGVQLADIQKNIFNQDLSANDGTVTADVKALPAPDRGPDMVDSGDIVED